MRLIVWGGSGLWHFPAPLPAAFQLQLAFLQLRFALGRRVPQSSPYFPYHPDRHAKPPSPPSPFLHPSIPSRLSLPRRNRWFGNVSSSLSAGAGGVPAAPGALTPPAERRPGKQSGLPRRRRLLQGVRSGVARVQRCPHPQPEGEAAGLPACPPVPYSSPLSGALPDPAVLAFPFCSGDWSPPCAGGGCAGRGNRGERFPRGRSPICRHRTQAEREPGKAGAGGRAASASLPRGRWVWRRGGGAGVLGRSAGQCRPWGSRRSPRGSLCKHVCRCLAWGSAAGFCKRGIAFGKPGC